MKKEMLLGIKEEREHVKSIRRLFRHKPSDIEIAKQIAKDHLRHNKHYYTKLKKVKL